MTPSQEDIQKAASDAANARYGTNLYGNEYYIGHIEGARWMAEKMGGDVDKRIREVFPLSQSCPREDGGTTVSFDDGVFYLKLEIVEGKITEWFHRNRKTGVYDGEAL
jgi:hypothetical protein